MGFREDRREREWREWMERERETLTDAVVLWTGWGRTSWPDRDDEKVIAEFGRDMGLDLVQAVRQLEDDSIGATTNSPQMTSPAWETKQQRRSALVTPRLEKTQL